MSSKLSEQVQRVQLRLNKRLGLEPDKDEGGDAGDARRITPEQERLRRLQLKIDILTDEVKGWKMAHDTARKQCEVAWRAFRDYRKTHPDLHLLED